MSKKEIKVAIGDYGYKIIKPSWHADEDDKCVVFVAYDEYGICSQFFVDYDMKYARRTMMTDTDLKLDSVDVGFMFWEVA